MLNKNSLNMAVKYPIGIQTFEKLISEGFVYVDKTEYIQQLVSVPGFYFLCRPRRFGKSLLLSTIRAFYEGQKELFKGLAISSYGHDWVPHPVMHFDLNAWQYIDEASLEQQLNKTFEYWEAQYGTEKQNRNFSERFEYIIKRAHALTGQKVVILVDEYDKPLLDTAANPSLQEYYRTLLKSVYGNLKSMDAHIEFAMLTGVTRFGKLSIFSDLNNLNDISMTPRYSAICGITLEEIHTYFSEGVKELAEKKNLNVEETYIQLAKYYDGYHFTEESPDIYNPFSLLNALYACNFGSYWFATGTPTFLIEMIKRDKMPLRDFNRYEVAPDQLLSVTGSLDDPVPVLYQAGYLTIKGHNEEFGIVRLGYPNLEVERGFLSNLFAYYTPEKRSATFIQHFVTDLRQGNVDSFMVRLQSLFSGYHYSQVDLGNLELHYRNVIYLVMKLMGYYTDAEMQTASGRIDLLVGTSDYLYLFEFKLNHSAQQAMDQINHRDYLLPFRADGRKILKIGANFDDGIRSISDWIVE